MHDFHQDLLPSYKKYENLNHFGTVTTLASMLTIPTSYRKNRRIFKHECLSLINLIHNKNDVELFHDRNLEPP